MIKILTACGSGINSSQEIAKTIKEELAERGINVHADAVMISDVTEEMVTKYDIFCPITKPDLSFEVKIPIIVAGKIMYKIKSMYIGVIDEIETCIKQLG